MIFKTDELTFSEGQLYVNGKPFVVTSPDEEVVGVEDGKILTMFRGCLQNQWQPEDVEGYFEQVGSED